MMQCVPFQVFFASVLGLASWIATVEPSAKSICRRPRRHIIVMIFGYNVRGGMSWRDTGNGTSVADNTLKMSAGNRFLVRTRKEMPTKEAKETHDFIKNCLLQTVGEEDKHVHRIALTFQQEFDKLA